MKSYFLFVAFGLAIQRRTGALCLNQNVLVVRVSTRAPREGVRPAAGWLVYAANAFQLAHPARGCDRSIRSRHHRPCGFNSRTPRGGATGARRLIHGHLRVSTRAPREGVRLAVLMEDSQLMDVSTRAPREGVRPAVCVLPVPHAMFQLAHPARGCDCRTAPCLSRHLRFNSRTPRGGATLRKRLVCIAETVSTRAPREGVRHEPGRRLSPCQSFNSRTPRGGATRAVHYAPGRGGVSTRAPREGVRLFKNPTFKSANVFQLAHPARGCDCAIVHAFTLNGKHISVRQPPRIGCIFR